MLIRYFPQFEPKGNVNHKFKNLKPVLSMTIKSLISIKTQCTARSPLRERGFGLFLAKPNISSGKQTDKHIKLYAYRELYQ